ncbi:MAG: hypothetical protein M5U12_16495 [Verrucomicrobia bacterium]|nr:hypothetical protein [Verrucomicrobiota bacterium]
MTLQLAGLAGGQQGGRGLDHEVLHLVQLSDEAGFDHPAGCTA